MLFHGGLLLGGEDMVGQALVGEKQDQCMQCAYFDVLSICK